MKEGSIMTSELLLSAGLIFTSIGIGIVTLWLHGVSTRLDKTEVQLQTMERRTRKICPSYRRERRAARLKDCE